MRQHFDPSSIIVILITVVLFVMALYEKGLTHDLLLEAGVFLVSVKLILGSYKNSVDIKKLDSKLDEILSKLLAPKKTKIAQQPTLEEKAPTSKLSPKELDELF
jgi:low affinity Fe/Cu permease